MIGDGQCVVSNDVFSVRRESELVEDFEKCQRADSAVTVQQAMIRHTSGCVNQSHVLIVVSTCRMNILSSLRLFDSLLFLFN